MIRVWGGGIYEADVFYEICDGECHAPLVARHIVDLLPQSLGSWCGRTLPLAVVKYVSHYSSPSDGQASQIRFHSIRRTTPSLRTSQSRRNRTSSDSDITHQSLSSVRSAFAFVNDLLGATHSPSGASIVPQRATTKVSPSLPPHFPSLSLTPWPYSASMNFIQTISSRNHRISNWTTPTRSPISARRTSPPDTSMNGCSRPSWRSTPTSIIIAVLRTAGMASRRRTRDMGICTSGMSGMGARSRGITGTFWRGDSSLSSGCALCFLFSFLFFCLRMRSSDTD